jgi:hypothetical protein
MEFSLAGGQAARLRIARGRDEHVAVDSHRYRPARLPQILGAHTQVHVSIAHVRLIAHHTFDGSDALAVIRGNERGLVGRTAQPVAQAAQLQADDDG